MLKNERLNRWMMAAATLAALAGATAYARARVCTHCEPCACDSNGGVILCCDSYGC